MRAPRKIDFSIYLRAFAVFARNPTVVVLPLVVAVLNILVERIAGLTGTDAISGGVEAFILQLLQLFALGVSVVIADAGWRRGSASFDDAWQDARRRGGDLLFAAFGVTFVVQIALYAGTLIGPLGPAFGALAIYGLVFAIPAAAIGGVPGAAAINTSIEHVRAAPLAAGVLAAAAVVISFTGMVLVPVWLTPLTDALGGSALAASLLTAAAASVATGYTAIVMAKVYADTVF